FVRQCCLCAMVAIWLPFSRHRRGLPPCHGGDAESPTNTRSTMALHGRQTRRRSPLMAALHARTQEILSTRQQAFLEAWRADLNGSGFYQALKEADLAQQTEDFVRLLIAGVRQNTDLDSGSPGWEEMRRYLEGLSRSRALLGFDSQQTAGFLFAAKRPLLGLL